MMAFFERKIKLEIRTKNKIRKTKDLLLRAVKRRRLSSAASITVEASLVLPIYIFFFVNIIGAFDILRLQCDMEAALHQAGEQISENAGLLRVGSVKGDKGAVEGVVSGAVSTVYAKNQVKKYLGEQYLSESCIVGGSGGISLAESTLHSNGDIINLIASYKVHPLIGVYGFTDFESESRYYGHAFTGYNPDSGGYEENGESEELVYITESGTAYHRSLDCKYLNPTVRRVTKEGVGKARNKDGAKYYSCEYCGKKSGQTVYVTDYGNRYHSDLNCPGIKRTIKTVPISEAIGRHPCSECG